MQFLSVVPDAVWAALLASALTLSGVIVTNRHARQLELLRQRHEASQKERERQITLRRDVYLGAIEALATASQLVGRLTDLEVSEAELGQEFGSQSDALAKINLVATSQTALAIFDYYIAHANAYLDLMFERQSLRSRKTEIDIRTRFIDNAQQDVTEALQGMKRMNLEGAHDEMKWNALDRSFKSAQELASKYAAERDELYEVQTAEYLRFLNKTLDKVLETSRLAPHAMLVIRKELDLPTDEDEFLKLWNRNQEITTSMLRNMISRLEALATD